MPQSGGTCRARNGRWESYDYNNVREDCAEERCTFRAADLPAHRSTYPTLMDISQHLRRGTECTHEQLVDVMEQVRLSMVPGVNLCA